MQRPVGHQAQQTGEKRYQSPEAWRQQHGAAVMAGVKLAVGRNREGTCNVEQDGSRPESEDEQAEEESRMI